jgi:hypothetical protein
MMPSDTYPVRILIMQKIIYLLLILLVSPAKIGAAEYRVIETPTLIATLTGEQLSYSRQKRSVGRLFTYITPRAQDEAAALEFALALSKTHRPLTIAALITVESNFDQYAVGKAGERGCGQILEEYHGQVPPDIPGQVQQIDELLERLVRQYGTEARALKAYNGAGQAAACYSRLVLKVKGRLQHG